MRARRRAAVRLYAKPDRKGREARDVMLGLYKTCRKQGLSLYHFIGDRLGIPGPKIPALATLVTPARA